MKKEKMNSATERNTLKETKSAQLPDDQTSFNVPKKKVKIKVPTKIPNPVPQK